MLKLNLTTLKNTGIGGNLNTSYVKVKHYLILPIANLMHHLNTSYVKVKQKSYSKKNKKITI